MTRAASWPFCSLGRCHLRHALVTTPHGSLSSRVYTPCAPNNEWIMPRCVRKAAVHFLPSVSSSITWGLGVGPRVITRVRWLGGPAEWISRITIFFFGPEDPFHSVRWRETRFPSNTRPIHDERLNIALNACYETRVNVKLRRGIKNNRRWSSNYNNLMVLLTIN